jgi:hypothetical protein
MSEPVLIFEFATPLEFYTTITKWGGLVVILSVDSSIRSG